MDILFSLVALVLLALVWARVSRMTDRLDHIERYLESASTVPAPAPRKAAAKAPVRTLEEAAVPTTTSKASPSRTTADRIPDLLERSIAWCKEDWLMKLGGLLVVLGASWFVSYAFAEGWVGPMGRIAIGIVVGAGVMALGRYRIERAVTQGSILLTVGALLVVVTLYAAREVYDFFTPAIALALMFATSSILGVTSVTLKRRPLAYANVLLAGAAPLLVASAEPSVPGLLTYLFVLTLGALAIVWVTGWRTLVPLSLGILSLYSLPALFSIGRDLEIGLMFAYAFTALFFTTTLSALRSAATTALVDATTALGTGVFLMVWVLAAAPEEWRSMLLIGWALVFALGSYQLFTKTRIQAHYAAYAAVGALYLAVVTALELEGPFLTMMFTLESAALVALGYLTTRRALTTAALSFVFIVPVLLSFEHMGAPSWSVSAFQEDSAALFLLMGVLALMACFFSWVGKSDGTVTYTTLLHIAAGTAGAYALFLTWRILHVLYKGDTGTTITLAVYALVGSLFYIGGRVAGASWKRMVAGVLYAIVLAQLLLVEVWSMALSGRVVTFLGIGALLMAVAWLERSSFSRGSKISV